MVKSSSDYVKAIEGGIQPTQVINTYVRNTIYHTLYLQLLYIF
jgi:hypothetical protein